MRLDEIPAGGMHPAHRATVYQRLTPQAVMQQLLPTTAKPQEMMRSAPDMSRTATGIEQVRSPTRPNRQVSRVGFDDDTSQTAQRRKISADSPSRTPLNRTPKMPAGNPQDKLNDLSHLQLPNNIDTEGFTTEEFTRAVAVATVNALKSHENAMAREWKQARAVQPLAEGAGPAVATAEQSEGHGGHEGPSWSRTVSACVLLGCTILYAIIAGKSVNRHR
jgi:Ca2+:H+ antiporter